ncbi:MAG: hypothetical protein Q7R43_01470 [Candidatus Daviesbacteria bacterium]|nr:hypothetical protein [Candidatus Daviesbacteria bacterium]
MEFETPTREDWEKLVGYVPFVNVDGNMLHILHPGRVVPTPVEYFEQMGEINLMVPGTNRTVSVPVPYLEKFHGVPCEQRSRKIKSKL